MRTELLEPYQYRLLAELLGWSQVKRWVQLAVDTSGVVWNLNTMQRMKVALRFEGNRAQLVEFDCGTRARVDIACRFSRRSYTGPPPLELYSSRGAMYSALGKNLRVKGKRRFRG